MSSQDRLDESIKELEVKCEKIELTMMDLEALLKILTNATDTSGKLKEAYSKWRGVF